ncbi:MAG: hypothetical protein RIG61_07420 [Deltaproteobacteria bacterium]
MTKVFGYTFILFVVLFPFATASYSQVPTVGTTSTYNGTATTHSWSQVVNTGEDYLTACGVYNSGTTTVSSVEFNTSEAMTVTTVTQGGTTIWFAYLSRPTVTTANIEVTLSASQNITAGGMTLNGANDGAPDVTQTASGLSNDPQISVTTTNANSIIVDCVGYNANAGFTADGIGQTLQYSAAFSFSLEIGSSTKNMASTGTFLMDWTIGSGAKDWGAIAFAIPEPQASGNSRRIWK